MNTFTMKRKQVGMLEDPLPEKFRKMVGYTDLVRNVMINYCAYSSHDLALRYIFPQADLQVKIIQWYKYLNMNYHTNAYAFF